MKLSIKSRTLARSASTVTLILILLSACAGSPLSGPANPVAPQTGGGAPSPAPAVNTAAPQGAGDESAGEASAGNPPAAETVGGALSEIIVYASDVPFSALYELDFYDELASPDGKLIGLPNTGDELDPPPENDPHLTFDVPVQSGIPYRCWVHMKVGEPKGRSTANVVWVQFSDSVDQGNQEVFRPDTDSYLTAQGPTELGWTWVGCDAAGSDSLVYFPSSGEVTVRIQAGAEGVGFDQFILSPAKFLNAPPSEPIVVK